MVWRSRWRMTESTVLRRISRFSPRTMRALFAGAALFGTVIIWSVYVYSTRAVEENTLLGLQERIGVDAVLLEDHVSRTLDSVVGVLEVAQAREKTQLLTQPDDATLALSKLIVNIPVVRSLSLVDVAGRVVASSSSRVLGVSLLGAGLPLDSTWSGITEVKFGPAFPLRDLHEIGREGQPVSLGFWTAIAADEIDGQSYHWVATINLGLFQNLWDEVDELPATAINLMDSQGRLILSHHTSRTPFPPVGREVLERQALAAQGSFPLGSSGRYYVAYRASRHYPATLVMIGDRDITLGPLDEKRRRARLLYLLVDLVVLGFIGALYGFYRRHEKLARELLNQSTAVDLHLMVSEYDRNGLLLRANEAFYRFNGYQPGELDGAHYSVLSGELRVAELSADLWAHLRDGQSWHGTLRNRRKSGELYWVSATVVPFRDIRGGLERVMVLMTDISESILLSERVENEQRLREDLARLNRELATDAATDPLTGLPNKRAFDAFIQRAIEVSREAAQPIAVIALDIDHFKRVNDLYGHPAGDVLLKELAHRWRQEIRSSDMLARIGGDEFCVVLPRTAALHAERIAEKLRLAVAKSPVVVDLPGKELRLIETTASVGVATTEVAAVATPEALLQAADGALYQAKGHGRDRVVAVTGG